ncbi:MAG: aldose 1-epimerase family protein [Erysipelotrichaceae bacterium]
MKLENQEVEVTFNLLGAEIQSFTDKATKIQYMWQGDEENWSGKNPTLFPIVSGTYKGGSYEIDGKTYTMKNHGFIRKSMFTCIKESKDQIIFEFNANEETLSVFPFKFKFHTIYELNGKTLTIRYEIFNCDKVDMPFGFGLHPGFNCPLVKGEKFEDYKLVFSGEEQLTQWIMDNTSDKGVRKESLTLKEIPLNYETFEKYPTLIYTGMKSPYVSLVGKDHGVKISISGYEFLAFWTAHAGSPFICLEPWHSHGDFYDTPEDFYHREGTMILSSDRMYTTAYTMTIY